MWNYQAHLDRLVDGDTFDVWIELRPQRIHNETLPGSTFPLYDFGFSIYGTVDMSFAPIIRHERLRLWGVNAPEIRGVEREEGRKSLQALSLFMAEHSGPFQVETVKESGKYGRYVAKAKVGGVDLSEWMVDNGHAVWKDY